jgi:hypothetical protein
MRTTIDDYRVDRRAHRARSLTAAIIQEIGPLLPDDTKRDVSRAVEDLLWRLGVDPLTDAERARIGLRPRDNKGWTDEEVAIYERTLTMAMLKPFTDPLLMPNKPPTE